MTEWFYLQLAKIYMYVCPCRDEVAHKERGAEEAKRRRGKRKHKARVAKKERNKRKQEVKMKRYKQGQQRNKEYL